jgi:hypothetical protein
MLLTALSGEVSGWNSELIVQVRTEVASPAYLIKSLVWERRSFSVMRVASVLAILICSCPSSQIILKGIQDGRIILEWILGK